MWGMKPEIVVRRCLAALLAVPGLLIVLPGMLSAPRPEAAFSWGRAAGLAFIVAAVFLCVYSPVQLPPGNPVVKRNALRIAAVLLLLTWYVGGMPVAKVVLNHWLPWTPLIWCAHVFYSPLDSYVTSGLPGADTYKDYCEWCTRAFYQKLS
jgi:hypothetical protein